ncbi:MAG: hypothetical protein DMF63_03805 [Acidobacteria bacterium]|nr:MAG: hypothetical protein DMF63_03805 [Acidobacteriota bacterium]
MFTKRSCSVVCSVVFSALVFTSSIIAQSANDGFDPLPLQSDIYAVALTSTGQMYVGGYFTNIGGLTRSGIAFLNHDGTGNTLFNAAGVKKLDNGTLFPGSVYAIVIQNDNKIVIAGDFTEVNGVARTNIARIDQFGNLDTSFTANANGPVFSLALTYDQAVIAGGAFTSVNGTARFLLARINTFGALDMTSNFDCQGSVIYDLKRDDRGRILIAGAFGTIGGTPQGAIARLNDDGKTVDTTFRTGGLLNGASIGIQADRKIVFGHAGGVMRFYPDGAVDPTLNITTPSWVEETAIQPDGKIVIGGFFTAINGVPRNRVARLNLDGTLDPNFDPNVGGASNSVKLSSISVQRDGKILIGGRMETIGGVARRGFGRVYPDGTLDSTTNLTVATGIPLAILPQSDGKTLVGGNFTSIGGVAQSKVSRISANGTVEAAFPNLAIDNEVDGIAVQSDGKILIAGGFTTVGGSPRTRLARLNSNGTLDTSFAPSINNQIQAVAIQGDGKILIGGSFTNVNGTATSSLARLNTNGTLDTTFNPNVNPGVARIRIQPDGKILLGGYFSTVGGVPRTAIARLNPNGTLDPSINVPFTGIVQELSDIALQQDGKILIGGSFAGITGTSNVCIARLLPSGAIDTSFTGSADTTVNSIAVQADGRIIVAGRFTSLNSTSRQYLGRLNANGSLDTTFTMNADDTIASMALQRDGKIVVGGNFGMVGGQSRIRLAKISNTYTAPETMWTASPRFLEWNNASAGPQVQRVTFEKSLDGINYTILGNGTVSLSTTLWSLTGRGFGSGFIRVRGYYPDASNRASSIEAVYFVPTTNTPFDFDGDGKTDIGIFRPNATSEWWIDPSGGNLATAMQFGVSTDLITPADFTGDGKTDIAFFRPSNGRWYVLRSEDFSYFEVPFGTNGDIPAPGDYDGDRKADYAVFRPSSATWFISQSGGAPTRIVQFGITGDRPVVADYDGDGRADVAIYRPGPREWWIDRSTAGVLPMQFGDPGDKVVPGDFTADGKADVAVWRPSTGYWYIVRSEDFSFYGFPFGTNGDTPAPGDYDGDGKYDPTVFRPSSATWFIAQTTAGTRIVQFGASGDKPLPTAFLP